MNLVYGEIVELFEEDAMRFGKIRIGGVYKNVSLELLADAERGDTVLMCDGVVISKVGEIPKSE